MQPLWSPVPNKHLGHLQNECSYKKYKEAPFDPSWQFSKVFKGRYIETVIASCCQKEGTRPGVTRVTQQELTTMGTPNGKQVWGWTQFQSWLLPCYLIPQPHLPAEVSQSGPSAQWYDVLQAVVSWFPSSSKPRFSNRRQCFMTPLKSHQDPAVCTCYLYISPSTQGANTVPPWPSRKKQPPILQNLYSIYLKRPLSK